MLKQILFILIFCSSLFAGQDSQTKTNSPLDYYNSALKLFNSDDENYDPVKALKLFRKAAEQGMSDAQFQVGWIYNAGIGVETNIAEAIKWYKKAANQNNESAQANLGLAYKYGEGVEKNLATSLFYFSQSASNGCALSQFELGWRYQDGISVTQDYKKAVEWYERAIKNGNTDALYNLAELYEKGLGASNDTIRAFMLYLDSAEHENPIAQEHVAKMYYFGNGTMRNRKKAFEWYKKAAENGVITAQGSLGYLYNYGIGVQTNYGEALKWYLKAAENGDTDSFYRIAIIYDKQKNKKAFDWFVKSAAAGDYYADFKLGYIFSEGKYTAKNLDKALEHFQKVIDSEMKEEIKGTTCLMIGGIQLKQGKTEEGFATLKKAVKYPSIKKILIVLAFVGVLGGVIFLTAMLLTLYFVLKNTKSFSSKKSWSIVEAVAVIGIFLFLQIGMSAMIVVPFFDKVCKDVFLKLLFWVFIGNGIVVLIAVLLSKIRPISVWKQFGFFKINFKKWALIVVGGWIFVIIFGVIYEWILKLFGIVLDGQTISQEIQKYDSAGAVIFLILIIGFIMPVIEELIFRGVLFQALRAKLSPFWSVLISSIIFAGVHADIKYFIPLLAMGFVTAYSFEKTKSIYTPIGIHILNNLFTVSIMILV